MKKTARKPFPCHGFRTAFLLPSGKLSEQCFDRRINLLKFLIPRSSYFAASCGSGITVSATRTILCCRFLHGSVCAAGHRRQASRLPVPVPSSDSMLSTGMFSTFAIIFFQRGLRARRPQIFVRPIWIPRLSATSKESRIANATPSKTALGHFLSLWYPSSCR